MTSKLKKALVKKLLDKEQITFKNKATEEAVKLDYIEEKDKSKPLYLMLNSKIKKSAEDPQKTLKNDL